MVATENKKALVYSILEFLQKSCQDGTVNQDDTGSIEVAMQCIGEAFGVDVADEAQKELYSTKPANLLSIFDVYLNTKKSTKSPASASAASTAPKVESKFLFASISEEDKQAAEQKKAEGNRKVAERNYPEAIKLYTEAISLNGNNAVYYANRAAAYSQQGDHQKAVDDAEKAIQVDSKYSKAYSRMGIKMLLRRMKKVWNSIPTMPLLKALWLLLKSKLNSGSVERSASEPSNSGLPNFPGGMPDLGSLLSNPALMNMAKQMMDSGALNNLMNNPNIAQMAQQMMGGNGGAPNFEEMMNDPEMKRLAREAMGGAGGAGGAKPEDKQ
ncbi:hypothetical protein [Parasitella parasitica]|uniref:SGTA homodimerisation domain-containing protein n=1 Tax=Parasitella parasitica TaxID=35722 RepID=A0A0B7MYV9_9FUNG|nr:hypothetical protein [Parasitella parasitica]